MNNKKVLYLKMRQDTLQSELFLHFFMEANIAVGSLSFSCCVSIILKLNQLIHPSSLVLFQMALIPLTMSRYTIAALSSSRLNYYLPLDKSLRIHIYLGYSVVSISFMAIFYVFLGLLCSEGDEASCDKLGSEIMITGYIIAGLLVSTMFDELYLSYSK